MSHEQTPCEGKKKKNPKQKLHYDSSLQLFPRWFITQTETKSTKPSPVCFGLAFLLKIYIPPLKRPPPEKEKKKKKHPAVTEVHHVPPPYMLIPDGSVNFNSLQVNFHVFAFMPIPLKAYMELHSSTKCTYIFTLRQLIFLKSELFL